MKIQRKFTTAARGMMAMKKDVAKDVMANLAENGTMFDKDKGKTGRMKMRMKASPKKPKFPTVDPNNPDDPNILNYPDGKFYQDEKGFIRPINRHPDYKRPRSFRRLSGEKGMKYNKAKGGMKVQYKMMQEGGKNGDKQKVYSANEIAKMSMKELADIMNGIADSKSKNKDFEHKGMILGNTANTIKLIQDEIKERMKNMTPEQMQKEIDKSKKPKSGEKGMTYKKGPGGMMISFVRKNK